MKIFLVILSSILFFSCSQSETNVSPGPTNDKTFYDGQVITKSKLIDIEKHNQSAVYLGSEYFFSTEKKFLNWVNTLDSDLQTEYFKKMKEAENLREYAIKINAETVVEQTGALPKEMVQRINQISYQSNNNKAGRVPAQYVTIYDGPWYTGQSRGIVVTPSIGGGMKNRAESCKISSSGGATIFWDRTWWRGESKVYFAFPKYEDPTMLFANRAESIN